MKTIFFLLNFFFCFNFIYGQFHVKFQVRQPLVRHAADKVFIAGSFNNWDPALPANSFNPDQNGQGGIEVNLPAGNYEYKFTRGSWEKTECQADGKDAPNRSLLLQKDTVIDISISAWKDDFMSAPIVKKHTASKNVKIIDTTFKMPQLNRQRRIWIYLPQDYTTSKKRYPVVYMHDGQNLFDEVTAGFGEWGVDEYLDSITKNGKQESIVIGIDNASKRMNEYNPYYFKQFGNGEGKKYVDFLVKTLKPYIDKHFHTFSDKQHTFIAGSSMGGLISLYAVLKYPSIFGGAGIFSPAFQTASGIDSDVNLLSSKMNSKLFFYAGASESDKMVPDMKRIEGEIKSVSGSSTKEIIDPGAKHNEAAWRKHFPEFYQWIFNDK